MAEMIVGALFPLVLLFALRVPADSGAVVPLALTFAACWLSDLPAAVVMTYALSLMIVTLAVVRRSAMTLWLGVAALALGFALAAFFIIPASYEQRWVQIEQAVSPDFRPESWEYDGRDADATGPTALRLRLLAYPAWVVRVNGRPVSTKTDPATGQLMVPVSAGSSRVEVSFARTFDCTIGGAVSILAAVLVLMLTLHPKSSSFSQAASTPPMH